MEWGKGNKNSYSEVILNSSCYIVLFLYRGIGEEINLVVKLEVMINNKL